MSTKPHEVAEAVAAAIRGASLSVPVTASRGWMPEIDLADVSAAEYRITVVPIGRNSTRISRADARQRDVEVFVRIDRSAPGTQDERDALADEYAGLCNEVQDLLWSARVLVGGVQATPVEMVEVVAQTSALDQMNQFTSSLTITYRMYG